MTRMRSSLAAAVTILLFAGDAMCSQMSFETLEEAVRPDTLVFRATLTSVERKDSADTLITHYGFEALTIVRGSPAAPVTSGTYSQRIPVMRDAKGTIVGSVSLRLRASGEENQVKKGDVVFLFADLVDAKGHASIVRIEPADHEADVLAVLAKQPATVKKK